jgi:hypothetical protein
MTLADLGQNLTEAERHFANIAAGGDAIESAYGGLLAVLRAADADTTAAFPKLAEELATVMQQVTPIIAEAAGRWINREMTQLGMAAATALVTTPPTHSLRYDQRCYAALLSCELSAALCRREIARRGDPLARAITVARAWNEFDRDEHRAQ